MDWFCKVNFISYYFQTNLSRDGIADYIVVKLYSITVYLTVLRSLRWAY